MSRQPRSWPISEMIRLSMCALLKMLDMKEFVEVVCTHIRCENVQYRIETACCLLRCRQLYRSLVAVTNFALDFISLHEEMIINADAIQAKGEALIVSFKRVFKVE